MPLLAVLLWLLLPGCLPPERSNDPLPDVKADGAAADAGKTDAKSDVKGDAAGDGATADGGSDGGADDTGEDVAEDTGPVSATGCKSNEDCAPLPTLPCHATPTCTAETGLCDSPLLDEGAACVTDSCISGQTCDASGTCAGGQAKNCDDKNPCTLDLCSSGTCSHAFTIASCSDGVQCTVSDHCVDGACVGTALDCNDGDPCTDDACNETGDASLSVLNLCKHQGFAYLKKVVSCTPLDPADEPFCNNGQCGMTKDCNDKNPCTDDSVNALSGECDHIFTGTAACGNDKCNPGTCQLVADLPTCVTKAACDDNKPCTDNKCSIVGGQAKCDYTSMLSVGTPCVAADPCVIDGQCNAKGDCKSTKTLTCNDGNACTDDTCLSGVGCTGTPNTAKCSDGDGCTVNDACVAGVCSGTAVNCDDANACTLDTCSAVSGCTHTLAPDGTDCGNSSKCQKGICKAP